MSVDEAVNRLWKLCHVLRDDGISYLDYATELSYLAFLKLMKETAQEHIVPVHCRWTELTNRDGSHLLNYYRRMLVELSAARDPSIKSIFVRSATKIGNAINLKILVTSIDQTDWSQIADGNYGALYDGLLARLSAESKFGIGQYFTPRPLVEAIVRLIRPRVGEIIQDPAAGTGGFLAAANRYILSENGSGSPVAAAMYAGMEIVPETHRIASMNMVLNGLKPTITLGDTLSPKGRSLGLADVVLSNPPFGTKMARPPTRPDFQITSNSANKQLAFVEHAVRALKPGGRAAIIVSDNVLFEERTGRPLREWIMDLCELRVILRLPPGIFYAPAVKTNVLFLRRGVEAKGNTRGIWIFDLRRAIPVARKNRPISQTDLSEFEQFYRRIWDAELPEAVEGHQDAVYLSKEDIVRRGYNLHVGSHVIEGVPEQADAADLQTLMSAISTSLEAASRDVRRLQQEVAHLCAGASGTEH